MGVYPEWFVKHLTALGVGNDNRLKDTLRKMRVDDVRLFDNIMAIIGSMFTSAILDNVNYSPAMHNVVHTRRSTYQT